MGRETERKADFFDLKSDVEALFSLAGRKSKLPPGNSSGSASGPDGGNPFGTGEIIGIMGMLHPNLEKQLGFETQAYLFELTQDLLLNKSLAKFQAFIQISVGAQGFSLNRKRNSLGGRHYRLR